MWINVALAAYAVIILSVAFASLRYGDSMENFLAAGRKQKKLFVVASTIGGGLIAALAIPAFQS